ncbi:MAG: T9SS type A sorting domain-containing protein [Bacteroidetes bacterium]|nr:T9SS type A sorting domain-containing protein [Bacteroidota bacterium]
MKPISNMNKMKTIFAAIIIACGVLLAPTRALAICNVTLTDSLAYFGCGNTNAQAFVRASGGTAPYQFKLGINGAWSSWISQPGGLGWHYMFSPLYAGMDTFYVQDTLGCTQLVIENNNVNLLHDSLSYVNTSGNSYLFTASTYGAQQFTWGDVSTGSYQNTSTDTIRLTLIPGFHTIISQVYNAATGCSDMDTIVVNVPGWAGNDQYLCRPDSAFLSATGTGTWSAWAGNPTSSSISFPTSTATWVRNLTSSGEYRYIWTTSSTTDTVSIFVAQPLSLSLSQTGTVCAGNDSLIITGATGYNVQWYRNGTFITTMNSAAGLSIGSTAGRYRAMITRNGCIDSVSINIAACPSTQYTNLSATICQGNAYTFAGQSLTMAGTYRDTLNASTGYDSIITLTLTVNPSLNLSISQSGSVCIGNDTLIVSGASGNMVTWTLNGSIVSTGANYAAYTVAGGNGSGSTLNQFNVPYGVATDAASNVYVLDQANNRVVKFPVSSTSATYGVVAAGGNGSGSGLNQLNQAYGLTLDASGNIYVSDSYNHRVIKFPAGSSSATSGTVVAGGNGQGNAANQLSIPTDVAFDASGNMYVCDFGNHRIQKFPAGSTSATSGTTVAGGNGQGNTATQLNDPIGVYVDGSGALYVADQHNHRIQKFPAGSTGSTSGTTVAGGNGAGSTATQLYYPNDVIIDGAGAMYVCDYQNSRIQKFPVGSSSSTSGTTIAGGTGSGATQFQRCSRFHIDSYGNMYVSDEGNNRIQKIQISNSGTPTYIATTTGIYQAISTNSSGCSDTATVNLTCITTQYSNVSASICQGSTYTFGGATLTTAGTYRDTLIAASGADSVVTLTLTVNAVPSISITQSGSICTASGDTLRVTGGTGSTITWIGNGTPIAGGSTFSTYTVAGDNGSGSGANQFKTPYGVQTDGAGNIYVLDQGNDRVQKFPPNSTTLTGGTTVAGGNGRGSALNQFNRAYGLYVDAAGNIWVADSYNHRVLKFAAGSTSATSGSIVAGGNGQGSGTNQLSIPTDVAFDAAGRMYVCDYGNNRIQKFPVGSTSSTSGTTAATQAAGNNLNRPIGVYIDASDNLYVADQHNGLIAKFPAGSTASTTGTVVAGVWGQGGAASNLLLYPNDMMVDAAGNLLVCDYQNSRIQQFAPGSTNGVTVAGSGGYGTGTYQFKFDNRFYLDAAGNMYISDEGNNRIQKYGLNSSTTSLVVTAPGTYLAIATNSSGCSDTVSVTIQPCLSDSVWPGDADHNGIADNNDLLPLGIGYGLHGFARTDQSIVWTAHYAQNWGMQFLNGTNGKHADCNGDGVIDANDTTAILLNFGFTHNKTNGYSAPRAGIPGLSLLFSTDTVATGDSLTVSLQLGDSVLPVSNLYGLAFTYHFDPIVIDTTTASFGFIPSFIGNSVNSMSIHKDFKTDGSVKAAITGINLINRSGFGRIAKFHGTITTGNINGKDYSYYQNVNYISDVTAVDRYGNLIDLNAGIGSNQVAYEPTGLHDLDQTRVLIYPNPASSTLTIEGTTQLKGMNYTITDITGRSIATGQLAGEKTQIDISQMAPGVYMLHLADQKQGYKVTKN